jgi:sec-independent protein translocase protein TatA
MELAIVLIIALVIVGPKKLPELGKSAGKGFREFKDSVTGNASDDEKPELTSAEAVEAEPVHGEVVASRS